MAVDVKKLAQYDDKRVNITFKNDEGEVVTQEGKVESASEVGVLFKERGKSSMSIIEPDDIESIELAAVREPKISVKKLKPVELGKARAHLADRHGLNMAYINSVTEQQAFDYHAELDHKELDLGHIHEGDEEPEAPIADVSDVEGAEPEPQDEGPEAGE